MWITVTLMYCILMVTIMFSCTVWVWLKDNFLSPKVCPNGDIIIVLLALILLQGEHESSIVVMFTLLCFKNSLDRQE